MLSLKSCCNSKTTYNKQIKQTTWCIDVPNRIQQNTTKQTKRLFLVHWCSEVGSSSQNPSRSWTPDHGTSTLTSTTSPFGGNGSHGRVEQIHTNCIKLPSSSHLHPISSHHLSHHLITSSPLIPPPGASSSSPPSAASGPGWAHPDRRRSAATRRWTGGSPGVVPMTGHPGPG